MFQQKCTRKNYSTNALKLRYSTCPLRFQYIPPALYLKIVLQNILRMGPTADVHLAGGHTKDNPTKIHFSNMNRLLKNLATIHTTYKKQELDILQNKCIFTHIIMGSTWYVAKVCFMRSCYTLYNLGYTNRFLQLLT